MLQIRPNEKISFDAINDIANRCWQTIELYVHMIQTQVKVIWYLALVVFTLLVGKLKKKILPFVFHLLSQLLQGRSLVKEEKKYSTDHVINTL